MDFVTYGMYSRDQAPTVIHSATLCPSLCHQNEVANMECHKLRRYHQFWLKTKPWMFWGNFENIYQNLSHSAVFRKKYIVCQDPGSGELCISCLDQSLFIQTSWTPAGLIRYLAELESVAESVLTRKVILTHAILKDLAEYQRFNWERLKNSIVIRQKKTQLFSVNLTSHQFRLKNPQPFKISL